MTSTELTGKVVAIRAAIDQQEGQLIRLVSSLQAQRKGLERAEREIERLRIIEATEVK